MRRVPRVVRLNKQIQQILSEYFEMEYPFERFGIISVMNVSISKDLRNASVWLSIFRTDKDDSKRKETFEYIKKHEYKIKDFLAHEIRIKYTPKLTFFMDETLEKADEVYRIIEDLRDE